MCAGGRGVHCILEDSTNSYRTSDGAAIGLPRDSPQQQLWVEVSKYKGSVNATHCHQIWYVQPNSLKNSHTTSYPAPSRLCGAIHCTTTGERGISSSTTVWLTDSVSKKEAVQASNSKEWTSSVDRPTAITLPYPKLYIIANSSDISNSYC